MVEIGIASLVTFVVAILYALSGAVQAKAKGEAFDIVSFSKTVILALVGAGALSATIGSEVGTYIQVGVGLLGSAVVAHIDSIFNSVLGRLPALPAVANAVENAVSSVEKPQPETQPKA